MRYCNRSINWFWQYALKYLQTKHRYQFELFPGFHIYNKKTGESLKICWIEIGLISVNWKLDCSSRFQGLMTNGFERGKKKKPKKETKKSNIKQNRILGMVIMWTMGAQLKSHIGPKRAKLNAYADHIWPASCMLCMADLNRHENVNHAVQYIRKIQWLLLTY